MSDAPRLFSKLAEIMGEVGSIEARGVNDFLGTKYVTEDDMVDAVRDKLSARQIVVLPSLGDIAREPAKTAKGKETALTTARVTFTFCDGETGETHACAWAGIGEDAMDKGLTKAQTSALRTFLLKTFLVSSSNGPQGAPSSAPRADGQKPLTQEQFDGINQAFTAAGAPYEALHAALDKHGVPREIEGRTLNPGERVGMLSALAAIEVHKTLAAMEVKS